MHIKILTSVKFMGFSPVTLSFVSLIFRPQTPATEPKKVEEKFIFLPYIIKYKVSWRVFIYALYQVEKFLLIPSLLRIFSWVHLFYLVFPTSISLFFKPLRLYFSACVLATLYYKNWTVSSIKKPYIVLFLQELTLLQFLPVFGHFAVPSSRYYLYFFHRV